MDYSAANSSLWDFIILLGILAGSVLLANALIRKISFIRKAMIPVPVLAGFMLLALKELGVIHPSIDLLEMLVYHSLALGFIAMSLRVVPPKKGVAGSLTGPKSGALIVSTYLVQALVGLAITIISPLP